MKNNVFFRCILYLCIFPPFGDGYITFLSCLHIHMLPVSFDLELILYYSSSQYNLSLVLPVPKPKTYEEPVILEVVPAAGVHFKFAVVCFCESL